MSCLSWAGRRDRDMKAFIRTWSCSRSAVGRRSHPEKSIIRPLHRWRNDRSDVSQPWGAWGMARFGAARMGKETPQYTSINPIIYELRLNVEFSHIEKANNTFLQAGNLRVHARRPTISAGFCKFKIEYSSQHPAEIFASCRNICILPNSWIRQRCNTTL